VPPLRMNERVRRTDTFPPAIGCRTRHWGEIAPRGVLAGALLSRPVADASGAAALRDQETGSAGRVRQGRSFMMDDTIR
jgi:hypothetical protein